MAFCVHCGTQVAEGVTFCPNCGKAVAQSDAGVAAAAPPPPYTAAAGTPIAENVAGMLAYFTIVPAIIFLLIEPYNRNRFVRFHSFQCIFAAVAILVIDILLRILTAALHILPVFGWMVSMVLWSLWSLAVLGLWILLVVKAYQHEIYKLPVIGDMAERQAGA
jgi:uncharacterized membrane protein